MQTTSEEPSVLELIAWLSERAADADALRRLLVTSGHLNAAKAERDAAMWKAVLEALARNARASRDA